MPQHSPQTFTFGDSPALCAELLALVRSGRKTATCEAWRVYEAAPETLPVVGRRDIALNWDGSPALEIETLSLTRCRFDEVTEAFALAEGETETLAEWRAAHQAYFARNGGFASDMLLLCERFRLVRDLSPGG